MFNDFDILEGFYEENEVLEMESCQISDTRLMGVLAIKAAWKVKGHTSKKLHLFFYIDCEDNGLERYMEYFGDDEDQIEARFQSIIGGLGASLIPINQRQLNVILNYYTTRKAIKTVLPLVSPINDIDEEIIKVENKIITKGVNLFNKNATDNSVSPKDLVWQAINYLIMRLAAHDMLGAMLINISIEKTSLPPKGTLMKNFIDDSFEDGSIMCEALIESNSQYYIAIFQIFSEDELPKQCKLKKAFPISHLEAALILRNSEYIIRLNFQGLVTKIDYTICKDFYWSTSREVDKGLIMMLYNKDNGHVKTNDYYLSDDYYGTILFTKYEEIILMAKNPHEAKRIMDILFNINLVNPKLNYEPGIIHSHYPIFHQFISSSEEKFMVYLNQYK